MQTLYFLQGCNYPGFPIGQPWYPPVQAPIPPATNGVYSRLFEFIFKFLCEFHDVLFFKAPVTNATAAPTNPACPGSTAAISTALSGINLPVVSNLTDASGNVIGSCVSLIGIQKGTFVNASTLAQILQLINLVKSSNQTQGGDSGDGQLESITNPLLDALLGPNNPIGDLVDNLL